MRLAYRGIPIQERFAGDFLESAQFSDAAHQMLIVPFRVVLRVDTLTLRLW
jgi:hypothetical protein